jgi:hypothetical protein
LRGGMVRRTGFLVLRSLLIVVGSLLLGFVCYE